MKIWKIRWYKSSMGGQYYSEYYLDKNKADKRILELAEQSTYVPKVTIEEYTEIEVIE